MVTVAFSNKMMPSCYLLHQNEKRNYKKKARCLVHNVRQATLFIKQRNVIKFTSFIQIKDTLKEQQVWANKSY